MLDPLRQPAIRMDQHVGRKLAGCRLGLHARDELAAGRADHLDADEGKVLAEFVDDLLLHLDEGRGVEDDLAFLARRLDQAVGGRERLCGARAADDREAAERGRRAKRVPSGQSGLDHAASHSAFRSPPSRALGEGSGAFHCL